MDFETLKTEYETLETEYSPMNHVYLDDERVEYWVSEFKTRLKECEDGFNLTEAEEESWRVASEEVRWETHHEFNNIKQVLQDCKEFLAKSGKKSAESSMSYLKLELNMLIRALANWTHREENLVKNINMTKRPWSRTGNPYCVELTMP